ncbi:MAG: hypothetical protein WD512_13045 [Candidatus Paceibacterota bacterium]
MKHEHFIEGAGIIKPGNPICIDVFWYRLGKITEPTLSKDLSNAKKDYHKTNKNKKGSNYDWNDFLQLTDSTSDNGYEYEYESDNSDD